jgi:4-amino-4-deoxy-L-arabinose transferase-like glycosyltransferase
MVVAGSIELSNDEVYYWTYAQYLQWNYFDHPPMIALLIRFFTGNLLVQQELFVRLGAIVCAAINTWQIYQLGRRVKDEYTGWLSACFFTASIYAGILAGLMILPDAPQMVFWLWALLLLVNIFKDSGSRKGRNRRLVLLGVVVGLCIMSKVHGVFIWAGAFLYMLLYKREQLKNPFLYLGVLLTCFIMLPIFLWNLDNSFVTLSYHGNRVGFFSHIQWDTFLRQLIGEFLYNNPVNVVIIVLALLTLRKTKLFNEAGQQQVLLAVSLPLIGVVWLMSLFKDTLPHWTGPAYTSLIPLAAAYTAQRMQRKTPGRLMPRVVKWAMGLPVLLLALLILGVHWLPLRMGSKEEQHLGKGDLLLDMSGWKQFGNDFNKLYKQDTETGIMKPGAFLISDYWFPAAHLDYYVARSASILNMAVGSYGGIHHYAWLNQYRTAPIPGQDAYYITVSNYFDQLPAHLAATFQQVDTPLVINQNRQGKAVRHFVIYRLKNYKGGIPRNGIME